MVLRAGALALTLVLVLLCTVSSKPAKWSNQWAIKVSKNMENVTRLVHKHGFELLGKVCFLVNFFFGLTSGVGQHFPHSPCMPRTTGMY